MADKAKCGGCNKAATSKTVQCQSCDLWWHTTCAGISEDMYKLILATVESSSSHCWCCRVCSAMVKSLRKSVIALEKQYQELDSRVTENSSKINSMGDTVEEVKQSVDQIKKQSVEDNKRIQNEVFLEIKQRDTRKKNLVFHKLTEPDKGLLGEDRKKQDRKQVQEILDSIKVNLSVEADTKFMYRVGEPPKDSSSSRTRPLIVGFHEQDKCEQILKKVHQLKNTSFKHVTIVKDLTSKQREEEIELRCEAEKRNSELNEDEAENYQWRVVGPRGERQLTKVRLNTENQTRKRVLSPESSSQSFPPNKR